MNGMIFEEMVNAKLKSRIDNEKITKSEILHPTLEISGKWIVCCCCYLLLLCIYEYIIKRNTHINAIENWLQCFIAKHCKISLMSSVYVLLFCLNSKMSSIINVWSQERKC